MRTLRISTFALVALLILAACNGPGQGSAATESTEPPTTTEPISGTTTPTSSEPTASTEAALSDMGPIYAVTFSEAATGVVQLDGDTGEIVDEVTGAIGEGADSLDYVRATDSLIYSRAVTAAMSEVVRVPAVGGEPEVLATGNAADASDDGSRLAVARLELVDGGTDQVVLEERDLEGNVINSWSDDHTSEEPLFVPNLAWSPDATRLAFEIRFEDGTEVYVLDTETDSVSIQDAGDPIEIAGEEAMLSAPFWMDGDRLGVIKACCSLPEFDSWEAVIIDPTTDEQVSSLFTVDYGISEVDVHAHGSEIAFIRGHDAPGFGGNGPNELKIWTPEEGIQDIGEEHNSVGW